MRTKNFLRGFSGIAGLLWFSACSPVPGQLLVMEGNFFNSRGMYTEAIASYLKALDYAGAAPYAEYGLGSVYFSLDEGDAALERFAASETAMGELGGGEHPELVYRLRYNAGIVRFEQGDYAGAADAFREALKIDGSRLEAKRNLELSLLAGFRELSAPAAPSAGERPEERERAELLFEYIREKERDRWKSREWIEEDTPSGPDY
jgi:Ca-activated chloride channel family protein